MELGTYTILPRKWRTYVTPCNELDIGVIRPSDLPTRRDLGNVYHGRRKETYRIYGAHEINEE